jgi:hypothetical protein
MKIYRPLLVLLLISAAVCAHGYWYATSVIQKYITRCGTYETLEMAIEADMHHNGFDPAWFEVEIKAQNRKDVPYTWYVIRRVKSGLEQQVAQIPAPTEWCGGSFYEHTRYGWVGMPEHFFNALGYLDFWMKVYRLYG